MKSVFWIAGIVALLYGLHRLALWMEAKGWIYYARKKASPNALGNAFLELQQIVNPKTKHVLEVRRSQQVEQECRGEPPVTGKTGRPT